LGNKERDPKDRIEKLEQQERKLTVENESLKRWAPV